MDYNKLSNFIQTLKPVDCGKELIRIGGLTDGGYLIPNDLEGIEYCFSPGVGYMIDFQLMLADRNIKSFMADLFIGSPPVQHGVCPWTFDKKLITSTDTENSFTMQSWINKYLSGYTNDLILEMDIEGGEYEVILGTPVEVLDRFRIVVIEFHYLHYLFDDIVYMFMAPCFEKLLTRFHIAHIHPNNYSPVSTNYGIEIPQVLEFTFYNKRRVTSTKPRNDFPHILDRNNNGGEPNLVLPKCWYI